MEREVNNQGDARERVAYLEAKSLELVKETVAMSYSDLRNAENKLFAWRREIDGIKKRWSL